MDYIKFFLKPYIDWVKLCILKAKFNIKKDTILLSFPDQDVAYIHIVFNHLDEYVRKKRIQHIVIVSYNYLDSSLYGDKPYISKVICNNKKLIQSIMKLRYLNPQLKVISMYTKEGAINSNLIGISNITLEDVICYCELELFEYK